jgi:hypothetical protein
VTSDSARQFSQFQPQLIDGVAEPVDEGEVLRYLGYPAGQLPSARIKETLAHWMEHACQRATPRAAYVVLPVLNKGARRLCVQTISGEVEFTGAIGQFLGMSRMLAVFVATAGPGVEALASELLAGGEQVAAMIVNAVGAERAEAAEAAVIDRVSQQFHAIGFSPTLPYSPGYCGMALAEQRKLFGIFGEDAAGVVLTPECLMRPIKSVSGLVGLAPADEVDAQGSPCDRCELHNCNMRR